MKTNFFQFKIRVLTILLLLTAVTNAQDIKIDSLKKVLEKATDTTRVNALNELGKTFKYTRSDTSLILAEQAYLEAEKLHFTKGMATATHTKMMCYMSIGNETEYEIYTRKSIPFYKELKEYHYLISSYRRLGEILHKKCRYAEAIKAYKEGLQLVSKAITQYKDWHIVTFNLCLGETESAQGNYESSYKYYKKALEHSAHLKDSVAISTASAWASASMGNIYKDFEDFETAKYYYDKRASLDKDKWTEIWYKIKLLKAEKKYDSALTYYKSYYEHHTESYKNKMNDPANLNAMMGFNYDYGQIYLGLKDYDNAIRYIEPALDFAAKNGNIERQLGALYSLSKSNFEKKDYTKALKLANELVMVAESVQGKPTLRDTYQLLSEIYEKTGNKDKANFYYRKYAELKDALKTDQFKQKLKLYQAEEEEKRKTGAIKQLKKEKQLLSAGIILLATTVASFLAFIWVQRKSLARKKLLQQQDIALKEAENEKRIAGLEMMALRSQMNPHFIFNCLNSINRFVLRNDTEAASGYLTKFSKLMRMVLENSKQVLIPLEEEVKCLELYIQMEQFRCKNSFTYYVKYYDGVNTEEAMIPPLLLQPFVENAIWHGVNPKEGDGRIGVEFFQREEALYCVIKDNGIGRKKASELKSQLSEHHKSMGLQITKERLAILGEQDSKESPVDIEDLYDENSNAAGTKVTIRIFSLPAFEELKPSLNL